MTKHKHAFVQLGRFGDILNMLPLVWAIQREFGENPIVVTRREYASLFEAVSYADVHAVDVPLTKVSTAVEIASGLADQVHVTQVYGDNNADRKFGSFCLDSWRLAVDNNERFAWGSIPLELDRRNKERERAFADFRLACVSSTEPTVLFFTAGTSSPAPELRETMHHAVCLLGDRINAMGVGPFEAERIQDLCGLMERAALVVAIDSAPLHLTAATLTPTIGLVTDRPTLWHGCAPKPHWDASVRYGQIAGKPELLAQMILDALARNPEGRE